MTIYSIFLLIIIPTVILFCFWGGGGRGVYHIIRLCSFDTRKNGEREREREMGAASLIIPVSSWLPSLASPFKVIYS